MYKADQMVRGLMMAGFAGLMACSGSSGGPTGPTTTAARGSDGGPSTPSGPASPSSPANPASPAPSGGSAGIARVRCEVRAGRSKISVDGNNLRPLGGTFKATVESGGNVASSGLARAVGDEVEFDFDSDPGDIREGATPISPTFIAAARVVGRILDAQDREVARGEAECEVR